MPHNGFVPEKYPKGSITQYFGENPNLYRRWGLAFHNGADSVAPHGTPMFAVEDGIVVDVKDSPDGFGTHVRLRSNKQKDGTYRIWVYGHCSEILCELGQKVKRGDTLAKMGNTGFVVSNSNPWWDYNPFAGTHLHLGVRIVEEDVNGWKYPGDTMRIKVLNYDNGVKGAVDPMQFLLPGVVPSDTQKMLTIISLLNQVVDLYKKLLAK